MNNFLSLDHLLNIENDIKNIDLGHILRTQPICRAKSSKEFTLLFNEIYVSMTHLGSLFQKGLDLKVNHNLFRYLTEKIDYSILKVLRYNFIQYFSIPASINLNINTILSDEFKDFLTLFQKNSLIVEIQAGEIFFNTVNFMKATDILRNHNVKICLDGLNLVTFSQINKDVLGVDLAKISWDSKININSLNIQKSIDNFDNQRIILCRCDSEDSVIYGQKLGISIFQGWYVDSVVSAKQKNIN